MTAALQCDIKDYACHAVQEGLRYVNASEPGYTRKLRGKHFVYFDTNGKPVRDEATVARIRKLAIPPAYTDVWICPHANGHIQATGIDARGRKQYRYHAQWRNVRDESKYQNILLFGEKLPEIRAITARHMAAQSLSREKVLATVVALLEKTLIRVGNAAYAKANKSYGLTTLRAQHVQVSGDTIRFRFMGKSGKQWQLKISDRRIARTIRACSDLEGQALFSYADEAGTVHHVTSGDVNQYLQEITGEAFTAKDFRTWTATVLAAMALQEYAEYDSEAQAKKHVVAAIEAVAGKLGNTPAICRKCYIHPQIITAYLDGSLAKQITCTITATLKQAYPHLSDEEMLVLLFLKKRLSRR